MLTELASLIHKYTVSFTYNAVATLLLFCGWSILVKSNNISPVIWFVFVWIVTLCKLAWFVVAWSIDHVMYFTRAQTSTQSSTKVVYVFSYSSLDV